MDGNWFNKVIRSYEMDPERQEVLKMVLSLGDPRICPATVEHFRSGVVVTMPKLRAKAIEFCWEEIDFDALKEWCETIYEDYAEKGVVLYDITSGNVMWDGENFILIDFEQFHEYTEDKYNKRKQWMHEQIHEVGHSVISNL